MKKVNDYSPEELAIIHKIYESPVTIERQMHLLPGRTEKGVQAKARGMGWKKNMPNQMNRMHDLMADGEPRTAVEIERIIGVRRKFVSDTLARAVKAGTYHVVEYLGNYRAAVFKFGPGVSVPRREASHTPLWVYSRRRRAAKNAAKWAARRLAESGTPRQTPKEPEAVSERPDAFIATTAEQDERELDEQFRNPGKWWKSADTTVVDAMRSMVSVGRREDEVTA